MPDNSEDTSTTLANQANQTDQLNQTNRSDQDTAQTSIQAEQGLTIGQKVDRTVQLLRSNTLNRPVLYRILDATAVEPLRLFDLETMIQAMPEFAEATQPPYYLIEWLIETEALSFTEVDAEGTPIADEQREGKTEDEIDDMIEDIIIAITDAGREALKAFDPRQRLMSMLDDIPDRYDSYLEVLAFLTEKRSYNDIDQLLRGRPVLMSGRTQGDRPMQPSVFVDKLAAVDAIIFDEGWIITREGRAVLEGSEFWTRKTTDKTDKPAHSHSTKNGMRTT
jgi:hypothetical protein